MDDALHRILNWPSLQAKAPPVKKAGPHPPYTVVHEGGRYYVKNALGEKKNPKGYKTIAEAKDLQAALYLALPPGMNHKV